MAEDTGLISAGLAQANGKLDVIAKNTENIGKAPQKDGLTKSEKNPELTLLDQIFTETKESLGGLSEQFEILNGVFQENTKVGKETAKFAEDTNKAILEELTIGQKAAEVAGVSPSEKNKTKATPTGKPSGVSILKDLSMSDGLGFIALWWKLDEIQGVLEDKDGKKKKSGGIGDIFKGLLEGVSGIALLAVALIAFAGALLIFQFVKWPEAIAGMVAFSIFTIGMIAIAKTFVKDTKTLAEFAACSVLMSFALAAFGVALWLSSALFSGMEFNYGAIKLPGISIWGAIEALLLFALFEQGIAHLAKSLGKDIPDITNFALGSMLMAGALAVFSISLAISSGIMKEGKVTIFNHEFLIDAGGVFEALTLFALFEFGIGAVAKIASKNSPDMVNFALGSMLMAGALIVFCYSLAIVSHIMKQEKFNFFGKEFDAIDFGAAASGVLAFIGFELGIALVAKTAGNEIPNMVKFALASIVMCGALIFFTYALSIVGNVLEGKGGPVGPWTIPGVKVVYAVGGLVLFAGFIAGMAALGMAANAALVPMVQLAGVSALMSLSMILFAGALIFSGIAAFGGDAKIGGLELSAPDGIGLKAIASLGLMVAFLAAFAGLGALMIPIGAFLLIAAPVLAGLSITTIKIAEAMALVSLLATGGELLWENKTYKIPKFEPGFAEEAFKPLKSIVAALSDSAKDLDKNARKSFEVIANSMVPITESLKNLSEIIGEYCAFSTDAGRQIVSEAISGMDFIMTGANGKGFIGMMNSIAKELKGMKKGADETAAAMIPITTTLEKLVAMVTNEALKKAEDDKIQVQINSLEGLGRFLNKHLIPLTKKLVKNKKYIDDVIPVLGDESRGFLKVVSVLVQINSRVLGINNTSFDRMEKAIKSLADSVHFLGEIKKGDITRMNEMSVAIPRFSKALESFDQSKAEGLASSITAIKNAVKGFGDEREDPFLIMSNSIDKAAKSVDSLNNSLAKTVNHLKDIAKKASKAFDKMKNIEINEATSYSSSGTSSVTSISTSDASLTRILNKWDMEGVPVKGFGAETDEKAMPVKVFSI